MPVTASLGQKSSDVKKARFSSANEMPVNDLRKTGPGYLIGPLQTGTSPVQSIVQCLSRKEGTDDFYTLKVALKLNSSKCYACLTCNKQCLTLVVTRRSESANLLVGFRQNF